MTNVLLGISSTCRPCCIWLPDADDDLLDDLNELLNSAGIVCSAALAGMSQMTMTMCTNEDYTDNLKVKYLSPMQRKSLTDSTLYLLLNSVIYTSMAPSSSILLMKCTSIAKRGREMVDLGQLRDGAALFNEALSLIKPSLGGSIGHASPAESQTLRDLRRLGSDLMLDLAKTLCKAQRYHESLSIAQETAFIMNHEASIDQAWAVVRGESLMGLKIFDSAARAFAEAKDVKNTRNAVSRMNREELGSLIVIESLKRIQTEILPLEYAIEPWLPSLKRALTEDLAEKSRDKGRDFNELLVSLLIEDQDNLVLACETFALMASVMVRAGRPRTACRLAMASARDLLPLMSSVDPSTERCLDLLSEAHFIAGLAASKAASTECSEEKVLLLFTAARSLARSKEIDPFSSLIQTLLLSVVDSLALAVGDGMKATEAVRAARGDPFQIEPLLLNLSHDEIKEEEKSETTLYRLVSRTGRSFQSKSRQPKHPFALSRVFYDSKQLPDGEEIPWIELDGGYRWRQTASSVSILVFSLPSGLKALSLDVTIRTCCIMVRLKCKQALGDVGEGEGEGEDGLIFSGDLLKAVKPSSSSWSLDDEGTLVFDLIKSNQELLRGGNPGSTWWDRLFLNDPPIAFDDQEKDYSDLPPEILQATRPNSKDKKTSAEEA